MWLFQRESGVLSVLASWVAESCQWERKSARHCNCNWISLDPWENCTVHRKFRKLPQIIFAGLRRGEDVVGQKLPHCNLQHFHLREKIAKFRYWGSSFLTQIPKELIRLGHLWVGPVLHSEFSANCLCHSSVLPKNKSWEALWMDI